MDIEVDGLAIDLLALNSGLSLTRKSKGVADGDIEEG